MYYEYFTMPLVCASTLVLHTKHGLPPWSASRSSNLRHGRANLVATVEFKASRRREHRRVIKIIIQEGGGDVECLTGAISGRGVLSKFRRRTHS